MLSISRTWGDLAATDRNDELADQLLCAYESSESLSKPKYPDAGLDAGPFPSRGSGVFRG